MTSIAETQERKEQDIDGKYHGDASTEQRQSDAAHTLQRSYRGHRARRELKGLSLSPSARWSEVRTLTISDTSSSKGAEPLFPNQAIKEAKYRDLTTPRPSSRRQTSDSTNKPGLTRTSSNAQQQWRRAGKIARRAGGDDYSSDDNPNVSAEDKEARRQARLAQREERMRTARTMDLAYFLEMVDLRMFSTRLREQTYRRHRADPQDLQTTVTALIYGNTTRNGKTVLRMRISSTGSITEKVRK